MEENKEIINHPRHYNIEGRKECIEEMIDKWGVGLVGLWCDITAYKYEYRAGQKDNNSIEQDNKKREWYLKKAEELKNPLFNNSNNMRYIAVHYGFDMQRNQTIEECGELIQALAKLNRTKGDSCDMPVTEDEARKKVIEELADVSICIRQLIFLMSCEYEINEITTEKLNRQLKRIKVGFNKKETNDRKKAINE